MRDYASKDESRFATWLDELVLKGEVIEWFYEPVTYLLYYPIYDKVYNLPVRKHTYTPDFKIVWSKPEYAKQYKIIEQDNISIVEIKPVYDRYNMTRLFKCNQKWLLAVYHIYINLIVVDYVGAIIAK